MRTLIYLLYQRVFHNHNMLFIANFNVVFLGFVFGALIFLGSPTKNFHLFIFLLLRQSPTPLILAYFAYLSSL